jgi:hypothetical protein
MATIAENLQIIKDSTEAIRRVILEKGGTISGGISTYADSISNIGGGGGSDAVSLFKKDINFYDYDGTLLHSYSKDEFLQMSSLPELPTRAGLICQGWNYNISDAKEYVGEYGVLDIGVTYITDDGKTRLYISINGRMNVPLYFSQTVSNGVTIDWGDGSATQTISGTGNINTTHTYADMGEYTISLNPESGCTLGLGNNSSSYCVLGSTGDYGKVYCSMLQSVEIGNNITSIGNYAFYYCYSLASIMIPDSVTSIGDYAFSYCYSLASIVIPNSVTSIGNNAFSDCNSLASIAIPNSVINIGNNAFKYCFPLASIVLPNSVTSIGNYAFSYCYSLASIVLPNSVTSIGNYTFGYCYGMAFYDFSKCASIPTLGGTSVFYRIESDCRIIVPDSLYDSWKSTTNWSSHASKIIKKSDWDAQNN